MDHKPGASQQGGCVVDRERKRLSHKGGSDRRARTILEISVGNGNCDPSLWKSCLCLVLCCLQVDGNKWNEIFPSERKLHVVANINHTSQ